MKEAVQQELLPPTFAEIARDFGQRYRHTPDILWLERHEFVPLFVADEMMRGYYGYEKLGQASFYGCTAYSQERFLMLKKNLGKVSSSILLDPAEATLLVQRAEILPVRGEVHFVVPYLFGELDTYMENGLQFTRKKIKLQIPYQSKVETEDGGIFYSEPKYNTDNWAYAYVGRYDYWRWLQGDKQFSLANPVAAKVPYYFHNYSSEFPVIERQEQGPTNQEALKAALLAKHKDKTTPLNNKGWHFWKK